MNSISPAYVPVENCSFSRPHTADSEISRTITSTWHVLEQTPPPSLREVLGAYNSRGDGDRDMLIAMLNAKTAEDQRIASVAALHRTLLEMQHTPPSPAHLPLPQLHVQSSSRLDPPPTISRFTPPHQAKRTRPRSDASDDVPTRRSPPSSAPPSQTTNVEFSRKRRRTSHNSSHMRTPSRESHSTVIHDSPHSPRSSSRSNSAEYSPRSRASMAIGSLLSSDPNHADAYGRGHDSDRRVNGCISPPTSLGPISV